MDNIEVFSFCQKQRGSHVKYKWKVGSHACHGYGSQGGADAETSLMGTRLSHNGLGMRSMDRRSGSGKRRENDIRTVTAKPHFRWLLAGLGCAKMEMMGTECPGKDRGPCKWATDPRSSERSTTEQLVAPGSGQGDGGPQEWAGP